jgi:HSP20 family protein
MDLIPKEPRQEPFGNGPADPLRALQLVIDEAFDNLWRSLAAELPASGGTFGMGLPPADVAETEDGIEVSVELPGVAEQDIEVTLADDVLAIRGEKQEVKESTHKRYTLRERRFGSVQRSIAVPAGIDRDKVRATLKDGVLTVSISKTEQAKHEVRRIQVGRK